MWGHNETRFHQQSTSQQKQKQIGGPEEGVALEYKLDGAIKPDNDGK